MNEKNRHAKRRPCTHDGVAMHDPIYALELVIVPEFNLIRYCTDTVVEHHPRFLRYARGDLLNQKQRKDIQN